MSSRLFRRLGAWALLPDDKLRAALNRHRRARRDAERSARARQLFAQALETPGGLKIQTIHSFCQLVLSRFPVEAGVPPRFQVLDERSAAELMRDGAQRSADCAPTVMRRFERWRWPPSPRAATMCALATFWTSAINADAAISRDLVAAHGGEATVPRRICADDIGRARWRRGSPARAFLRSNRDGDAAPTVRRRNGCLRGSDSDRKASEIDAPRFLACRRARAEL